VREISTVLTPSSMTTTCTTIKLSFNDPTATRKWLTPWMWYYSSISTFTSTSTNVEFHSNSEKAQLTMAVSRSVIVILKNQFKPGSGFFF